MPDPLPPFSEAYERFRDPIYAFCLSQTRDPAAAEDLAAEVFVSAFKAYERTRPDSEGVQFWLFRIARNAVIDRSRATARWRQFMIRAAAEAPVTHTVEATVMANEQLRRANVAMAQLARRDQLLIGLRVVSDLSFADIAKVMRMSEHAAGAATRRALDRVRELLSESQSD